MRLLLVKPLDEKEYAANTKFNAYYSVGTVFEVGELPKSDLVYGIYVSFQEERRELFGLYADEISHFKELK